MVDDIDKQEELTLEEVTIEGETEKSIYFETEDGVKWGFSKNTPNPLKVSNGVYKLSELIEKTKLMEELIYGRSFFIEKL
ncbi:hypothetical protein CXF68_09225 [Tenacibaculum sp. Bg11-29]|uniref:hypothetical protein n=1 Tax=Tenacibaculum sp. Bg11-29 TaxID=2058306 RepID=UPI000C31D63F|nr:hypothetical protein [Tenacibaculum sp. Bg11-29]PKH50856.1 hypothetical protein CXF68_09225 [Tenacibaculum sp. Bg11-29]